MFSRANWIRIQRHRIHGTLIYKFYSKEKAVLSRNMRGVESRVLQMGWRLLERWQRLWSGDGDSETTAPVTDTTAPVRETTAWVPRAVDKPPLCIVQLTHGCLHQPARGGLHQPPAGGLHRPLATGLHQPPASSLHQSPAVGLHQPLMAILDQSDACLDSMYQKNISGLVNYGNA